MICSRCKKNEANFHITKVVNGVKYEEHLCEVCAKNNAIGLDADFSSQFSFQNILSGFIDYMANNREEQISNKVCCKKCGQTYEDFKKTGLLGCDECYESFREAMTAIIKRVQLSSMHNGKIPQKYGNELKKKREVLQLKEKLKNAIEKEEYEKAAEIRDVIRELER
ncbi:UvrB/UvrC motif-containing protein [Clostridium senegalense]|uniref:UvrB/UvrC motif-containing protein n=1 Tax=Clostridium senegalense TaxID=1465809 RepID=UPI001C10B49C|nr:UvrB/UvrC motif-containing protein [Clostridium senegalense]MBU5226958.1 UvrB/UvrC motif-containing protein [Clostridium senegalense]